MDEDRGIFILPVQLTTSRIGNLTGLIHTLLCDAHAYIHTYIRCIGSYRGAVHSTTLRWCIVLDRYKPDSIVGMY